jgi:hypothetical protein
MDHVIPAQCEGIVMARMENPLGVENGLVEPNPQAHPPEEIYLTRTLVQDRQEVPVRVPSPSQDSSSKLGHNHSGQATSNQRGISAV